MKKVILVATLGMFALTACKKDYNCDCTVAGQTSTTTYKDSKKNDAEAACSSLNTTAALIGGSCTLK